MNPLEYLIEHDDVVWFTYGEGRYFEGWVMDVSNDALLVMWRASPFYAQANGTEDMGPPDEWILVSDIDMDSVLKEFEPVREERTNDCG